MATVDETLKFVIWPDHIHTHKLCMKYYFQVNNYTHDDGATF